MMLSNSKRTSYTISQKRLLLSCNPIMVRTMNNDTSTKINHQGLQRVGHCLYRSDKTRVYYAILKRNGKQIKRSLITTDQALAKRRMPPGLALTPLDRNQADVSQLLTQALGVLKTAANYQGVRALTAKDFLSYANFSLEGIAADWFKRNAQRLL